MRRAPGRRAVQRRAHDRPAGHARHLPGRDLHRRLRPAAGRDASRGRGRPPRSPDDRRTNHARRGGAGRGRRRDLRLLHRGHGGGDRDCGRLVTRRGRRAPGRHARAGDRAAGHQRRAAGRAHRRPRSCWTPTSAPARSPTRPPTARAWPVCSRTRRRAQGQRRRPGMDRAGTDPVQAARALGAPTTLLTRGADGATVVTADADHRDPRPAGGRGGHDRRRRRVRRRVPGPRRDGRRGDRRRHLRRAVAAITCTRAGADPPRARAEL